MGHGKETPRQKMIGMMYLVLTAMLALNVSKDILDAFVLVDEGLFKTTSNFAAKNETAYNTFDQQMAKSEAKVKPWRNKAYSVRDMADQLVYDMQQLKVEIVQLCDGADAEALVPTEWEVGESRTKKPTFNVLDAKLAAKDNMDKPAEIMITRGKGAELKNKIISFREHIVSLTADTAVQRTLKIALDTNDPPKTIDGMQHSWESNYFEHIPMVAVVTMLTKLQSDVRNAEADILQNLLTAIDAGATKVNKMEAIVMSKSGYILKGGEYEARIILAAYDSLQKPQILIGPYKSVNKPDGTTDYEMTGTPEVLPYDEQGRAIYRRAGGAVGNFTLQGLLQLPSADGVTHFPFSAEYQVGEASAVIAATKMNVFYIGVDNPVSISVSGVPSDKISATMTNGSLVKSGGSWIAKPGTVGKSMVTVSANINGQNRTMGTMEYRIKSVPNPVAKVAGKIGGRIDKGTLGAQMAVIADMEAFDFDLKFRVTEFTVSAVIKGFTQSKSTKSATITSEQKTLINGLTKGSKVYFEDIKVVGPDNKPRELPAISFTID